MKVRHKYDPVWSWQNYWTPWAYGLDFAISGEASYDYKAGGCAAITPPLCDYLHA